jgi:hypothetical protein
LLCPTPENQPKSLQRDFDITKPSMRKQRKLNLTLSTSVSLFKTNNIPGFTLGTEDIPTKDSSS